ncbi:MAG: PAS domain-containing protein [Burkholderiales bacterium]|nr:PAS domain-containing protein [Candidatus Obscuribacterales bacterium]MBY0445008.1 PAS domain-containing protein [Burkholderiales bacterium]
MSNASLDATEERRLVFSVLKATLETIGGVVGRNTEIVVHDLTKPESSVVAIVNGHISGRIVGSPVLIGPSQDLGFAAVLQSSGISNEPVVIPNYPTTSAGGSTLRSSTAVFRDTNGHPYASLCVNADLSGITAAHACLEQLLGSAINTEQKVLEQPDMEVLMAEIIQTALSGSNNANRLMNKKAKLEAVRQMQERGIFIVKGGIEKAAAALGVTRYTIYNYLDEIRSAQTDSCRTTE